MTNTKLDNFGTKLKKWQPGQSGNPKGRPPKLLSITSQIKEHLSDIDEKTGKTNAQLIAEKLIELALAGNLEAIKEILNRVDGRVAEKHLLQGDMPISIIFTPAPLPNHPITIEGEARELVEKRLN